MTTNATPNNDDSDNDDVTSDLSGQFYRQADFDDGQGKLVTIAHVDKTLFEAKNGRPEERKWVLTFTNDRCHGLNKTNLALCAKWFGKHANTWVGQKVVVYRDESVSYGGRLTGGLRLRKPTAADLAADARNDDIPF